ncbi:MAG: Ig-like domain-containing protein [Chlorobi bacterium]|nr:Ig-like domain-containing protein [Chlorobiota bacterium]MCI0715078.1 Ig-like domain-containing protein [Chlorobiota bacterium]
MLIFGCANQQPPGGGEEDKIPPKVKIVSPKPNSTGFKSNAIVFEFNEYVDRRSFQDAFRISPQVKGDIEFNWGGKEVEVRFPFDLYKIDANKTFVVNINSSLKDIRGNAIAEPVNFAFSTGSAIDMGGVSGLVYNAGKKIAAVLAYNLNKEYDPTKNTADYITETSAEGIYNLTNLAAGKYRIITVIDEDRNLLFTSERESYGVLPFDVEVKDSVTLKNVNFYLKDITADVQTGPELDYTKYFKDTLLVVFSSVEKGSRTVLPEQSIFLFFNKFKPSREVFINSFKLADENGTPERVVFNWKNDSLVEIFSSSKFQTNRKYNLSFRLKLQNDSIYNYNLEFRTVSENSFGEMKGVINSNYTEYNIFDFPIKIEMEAKGIIPLLTYNFEARDSVFSFKNILDAEYSLFSFADKNNNSLFDFGYPFPFEYSEPFYIYPQALNIKGGWTVENVVINFVK